MLGCSPDGYEKLQGGYMVAFLIIFGGVVGIGLVAWALIKTLVAEQRKSKSEQQEDPWTGKPSHWNY